MDNTITYKNTHFPFLGEDCLDEFGDDKGKKIYEAACLRLNSMLENADYKNNRSIKIHFSKNMFPIMAYYLTLLEQNYSKYEAHNLTLKIAQKAANIQKIKNESFRKIPFAYNIFKFFTKSIMKNSYPKEGWDIEYITFDNKEIHINFKKCIYVDMTSKYNCPEICTIFCKNDPIIFSGYEPKIYFKRNGTIAEGFEYCDFHFIKGK
jgi:hypothetical protein